MAVSGGSSALGATVGTARGFAPRVRFAPYLALTISATPLPSIAKAGISIQNHQIRPAGAKKKAPNDTNRNPTPMKALVIPFAMLAGSSAS